MKFSSTLTSAEDHWRFILHTSSVCLVLAVAFGGSTLRAAESVVPGGEAIFKQYCVACHGDAAKMAGVSFTELTSRPSVAEGFHEWEKVVSALQEKRMPPAGMPQPSEQERAQAIAAVQNALLSYAKQHDGAPGRVTVRRLTSGEYTYTIEDLTGLDLNFDRDFVADSVGGEGFTNYGDAQFMADASLELYLEAAKRVADHAVIGAGPLQFYTDPGMSGFEMSAIHRIHDIYRQHGFRAVAAEGGRAFGLELYGKAFFAAWQYEHRAELGMGELSLEQIGAKHGLSPRFVQHIWRVLQQPSTTYPTSEVVTMWKDLPAPGADADAVMAKCTEIQGFVISWPRWLFGAGELAAGGAGDERALVITDAAVVAKRSEELNFVERIEDPGKATVHISLGEANPQASTDAVVIFRGAAVRMTRGQDSTPLRELLDAATIEKLALGHGPAGTPLGPDDFALPAGSEVDFQLNIGKEARFFSMKMTAELAGDPGDAVLRLLVSQTADGQSGRPSWALLADSDSPGFKSWKANVLEYAGNFPQASHGEPTPADRDPIPPPFNNDYNQPERDRFHQRVKYYRQDDFLVDKILDDATRQQLDEAWSDLMASFEFHQATLNFVNDKYDLKLEKGIAELTEADIAAMPEEAQHWARTLTSEYQAVMAQQAAAQPGHVDDAIAFAQRAWRRPLTAAEKDSLRGFYVQAREELQLDHRKAVRALLTRILVAPSFLYRLEEPDAPKGVTELTDYELASRLSYFLWSSTPDQELLDAASAGKLREPQEMERQVRRMLAAPKARRLATEFFGQWLGFYRFDQYRGVDAKRYPEFTDKVKASMYDEAVSLFEHIIRRDKPIRDVVFADYDFLNKDLAQIYGLDVDVEAADGVTLVEGTDKLHRGGALRLGAVLTATSAPLRTSPVKRGDWVLRRIVGTPVPPPPPNAGSIAADDKAFGSDTVFERLQAHKRNATCAGCHNRIDPLGFPLEHYDTIGRWRNEYPNGQPIHDSGTLTDKTEISGVDGLIGYLESQEDQILKNLSNKLLGFALGRTVLASDQLLVRRLTEAGGRQSFADMATAIATSAQFRTRLGREEAPPSTSENPDSAPAAPTVAGAGGR
ncbi:MAG: DUF1592 domain-containing protein [Acidobacteria bacterium]|nr:DUF1592 domain-containing protein [Acidobacteriota bacterium]